MTARPHTSGSFMPERGLQSKFQIGSVHGRINFDSEETAFPYEQICHEKRKIKLEVIKGSRPQILSKSKPWNSSVQSDKPPCAVMGNQLAKFDQSKYKYNFRAEVLPSNGPQYIPKASKLQFNQRILAKEGDNISHQRRVLPLKRAEEMPVHPKLAEKPGWNLSTTVDKRAIRKTQVRLNDVSKANSDKQKRYLLANYKSPLELENERCKVQREQREARVLGLKSKNSSYSSSAGNVAQDSHMTKSANWVIRSQSKTKSNRRYKEYYNDGVWEYSKIEGCYVWSCSMNTNQHFRGSCYKVRNPDAWNFASP